MHPVMSDDETPRSDPALDALGARIDKGRQVAGLTPAPSAAPDRRAAAEGLRAGIEFMVSTVVVGGLGYGLGYLAEQPLVGLVIGAGFGFAAGLRAVQRAMAMAPVPAAEKGIEADGREDH